MERKDAIKVIKSNWPDSSFTRLRDALETLIPELKESEDERAKKEITELVMQPTWKTEKEFRRRRELCDWIKKQGEKKHTAAEVLIKAGLKPYKDGDQWCVLLGDNIQEGICGFGNTIEDALYAFLKDLIASQGWQKSNGTFVNVDDVREDFVQEVYRVLDADSTNDRANQIIDAFDNLPTITIEKQGSQILANSCKTCKDEQKSIWSEEDIATISRVISIVKWAAYSDHSHPILNDEGATELVERLKSLKDMVQPKQEWSEEDENRFKNLIELVKQSDEGQATKIGFIGFINRLRTLKERFTWKPSDKQMEVLNWCKPLWNEPKTKAVLESLIDDLKKLREE